MKKILIPIVLVVLAAGLVFVFANSSAPLAKLTNRELALKCDVEMAQGFHIHSTLEIIADGKPVEVPANIGVQQECMTALHTHTPDGLIHVESPLKRDFTLGDFFAVWKQLFTKDEILGYKTDATHRIRITVNGTEVDTYEDTVLIDNARIVITYETI